MELPENPRQPDMLAVENLAPICKEYAVYRGSGTLSLENGDIIWMICLDDPNGLTDDQVSLNT